MQLKVIHVCRPLVPKKSYIDFDILINYFLSINTIEWFHRRRSSNMWISERLGLTVPLRPLIRAATRPDDTIILKTGGSSLDSAGPVYMRWVSENCTFYEFLEIKSWFFQANFLVCSYSCGYSQVYKGYQCMNLVHLSMYR